MKRKFTLFYDSIVFLMVCFIGLSCKKDIHALSSASSGLSEEKATTFTNDEKLPVDATVFVPCANDGTGEDVRITGTLHLLIHTTTNGHHFTTKYHVQPAGVKGIGVTTGTHYAASGASQEIITGQYGDDAQYSGTTVNNFHLVGAGKEGNYLVHTVTHLTINANGRTTASIQTLNIDCK